MRTLLPLFLLLTGLWFLASQDTVPVPVTPEQTPDVTICPDGTPIPTVKLP